MYAIRSYYDSGTAVQAYRGGVVDYVDASRIVVRVNDEETAPGEVGVDIYNLVKYQRSNQNTNINQRPRITSYNVCYTKLLREP